MSAVLRFINIIEKILIALSILCFIPISVFVFHPSDHKFTPQQLETYKVAWSQSKTPFLVSPHPNICSFRESLLNNTFCFQRANPTNKLIVNTMDICVGNYYIHNNRKYCTGIDDQSIPIVNSYVRSPQGFYDFVLDVEVEPIWSISLPLEQPQIVRYHYDPKTQQSQCEQRGDYLTEDPQTKFSSQINHSYKISSQLLWFSLLPTLIIALILIIINEFSTKFNFKKYVLMACFCLDVGLITIAIKGIAYYEQVSSFSDTLIDFSTCFVGNEATTLAQMGEQISSLSFGFVFFIGIVALIIFLVMFGEFIAKILEWKYYKNKIQFTESDLQLSQMKTSLRPRRLQTMQSEYVPPQSINIENYQ